MKSNHTILSAFVLTAALAIPQLASASTCGSASLSLSINGVTKTFSDTQLSAYAGPNLSQAACEQFAMSRAAYGVGISLLTQAVAAPSAATNGRTASVTISGTLNYNGQVLAASGNMVFVSYLDQSSSPAQYIWDLSELSNGNISGSQAFSAQTTSANLAAGLYRIPNGQVYYVSGSGHTCLDTGAAGGTPVSTLKGQILDGVCGNYATYSPGYQAVDADCFAEIQATGCGPAGTGLGSCLNVAGRAGLVSNACRAGLMNFYVNSNGLSVASVGTIYPNLFPAANAGLYAAPLLAVDIACETEMLNDAGIPLAGQGLTAWLNAYAPAITPSCLSGLETYFHETAAQLKASYPNL